MDTKKQKVINFIKSGDYKKALSIMKGFKREFSNTQQRHLQIAYETWSNYGRQKFYSSIGVDWRLSQTVSKDLIRDYAK